MKSESASEPVKRRRRWPRIVLAIALLGFLAPTAWRFRPMSAGQRQFLGTWRVRHNNETRISLVTFGRGRTLETEDAIPPPYLPDPNFSSGAGSGSWSFDGHTLAARGRPDLVWTWRTLFSNVRHLLLRDDEDQTRYFAEFDGPDCIRLWPEEKGNPAVILERL